MGYNGLYEVSNLGRVKSVERIVICKDGRKLHLKEKILKPAKNTTDYLRVVLRKNGVNKTLLVHRLVAEAFIPNPDPDRYTIVNHKIEGAEGKLINTVGNLEWCDYPYNNTYGTARERRVKANSKKVYQYTTAHELVKEWSSTKEVARQTGWSQGNISNCCLGKYKTYKGFKWSYTPLL